MAFNKHIEFASSSLYQRSDGSYDFSTAPKIPFEIDGVQYEGEIDPTEGGHFWGGSLTGTNPGSFAVVNVDGRSFIYTLAQVPTVPKDGVKYRGLVVEAFEVTADQSDTPGKDLNIGLKPVSFLTKKGDGTQFVNDGNNDRYENELDDGESLFYDALGDGRGRQIKTAIVDDKPNIFILHASFEAARGHPYYNLEVQQYEVNGSDGTLKPVDTWKVTPNPIFNAANASLSVSESSGKAFVHIHSTTGQYSGVGRVKYTSIEAKSSGFDEATEYYTQTSVTPDGIETTKAGPIDGLRTSNNIIDNMLPIANEAGETSFYSIYTFNSKFYFAEFKEFDGKLKPVMHDDSNSYGNILRNADGEHQKSIGPVRQAQLVKLEVPDGDDGKKTIYHLFGADRYAAKGTIHQVLVDENGVLTLDNILEDESSLSDPEQDGIENSKEVDFENLGDEMEALFHDTEMSNYYHLLSVPYYENGSAGYYLHQMSRTVANIGMTSESVLKLEFGDLQPNGKLPIKNLTRVEELTSSNDGSTDNIETFLENRQIARIDHPVTGRPINIQISNASSANDGGGDRDDSLIDVPRGSQVNEISGFVGLYGSATQGNLLSCFTRGTMIETEKGPVSIEHLKAGDIVLTRDNGPKPIKWISSRKLDKIELERAPKLCPIRISANALGYPHGELVVSPQHRMLLRSALAEQRFGTQEVLVGAKFLLGLPGVEIALIKSNIEYWHFLFDSHELVKANDCWAESMFTGPQALKSVSDEAREEIFTLFPCLRSTGGSEKTDAARRIVEGRRARALVSAMMHSMPPNRYASQEHSVCSK